MPYSFIHTLAIATATLKPKDITGVIMADASGQGFTASIVNSIPNYLSADRSTLGQVNGVTAAIQYVKLVWGNSGNAYFVDDQGADPTPLPISLNNAENYWLIDAVENTVKSYGGLSAVNVNVVNSTGLCFAGVNLQLDSSLFIAGVCAPLQGIGSSLGVTFGGITFGPTRIRNFVSGSGVTEAIAVTFGNIGGTVAVSNMTVDTFSFGTGGITIGAFASGVSLPAQISGGTLDGIKNTVGVNIKGADAGLTIGVVLRRSDGAIVGSSGGVFTGYPVTFAGVQIAGTPSVSVSGTAAVEAVITNTPQVTLTGTPSVAATITNAPNVNVANTAPIPVTLSGGSVEISNAEFSIGETIGTVLSSPTGAPIGYSGSQFVGYPVQIVSGLSGICFGNISVTVPSTTTIGGVSLAQGVSLPVFLAGGTATLLNVVGGTFQVLNISNISGGTLTGIINAVKVKNDGTESLNVAVTNSGTDFIPVQPYKWETGEATDTSGDKSLYYHLKNLPVSVSGFVGGLTIGAIASSLMGPDSLGYCGACAALGQFGGLGVTFGDVKIGTISTITNITDAVSVKGHSDSLTTSPVGITLTGALKELQGLGISGTTNQTVLGIGVYAKGVCGFAPIGISGDALKVAIEGVGICLGTVSASFNASTVGVSGTVGLSGGTADFLNIVGGTIGVLTIGNISGGSINIANTISVTGPAAGMTIINSNTLLGDGPSYGYPLKVIITKDDGTFFPNDDKGTVVVGTTAAPIFVQGWVTTGGATFVPIGATISGPVSIIPSLGSSGVGGLSGGGTTFSTVLTTVTGVPIGYGLSGTSATFYGIPVIGGVSGSGGSVQVLPVQATFGRISLGSTANTFLDQLYYVTTASGGITNSWLGVTWQGTVSTSGGGGGTFDGIIRGVCGGSANPVGSPGFGLPFLPVNNFGQALSTGYSGTTFIGFPILGISGATAVGVTFGTALIAPATGNTGTGGLSGGGTTFNTVLTTVAGVPIGYGISGTSATFYGIPVIGGVSGSDGSVQVLPVKANITGFDYGGITYAGNCLGAGVCGDTTIAYRGGTWFRVSPYQGNFFEPGFTLTGAVSVVGNKDTAIGVTFIGNSQVITPDGTSLAVSLGTASVSVKPSLGNTGIGGLSGGGTTFSTVLTTVTGVPIGYGLSGTSATFYGIPVIGGVSGSGTSLRVLPVEVTFGSMTFGAAGNLGVTFGSVVPTGITFSTVRTVLVGSCFADGGGNLGIPVFGVAGATSVRVQVEGGTVAGIFVTEAPGITVMGVSSGIPIIGVTGATPVGVTFSSPIAVTFAQTASQLTLPTSGITIASWSAAAGTVTVSGNVSADISNLPSNQDFPIKAGKAIIDANQNVSGQNLGYDALLAGQKAPGIVVTEKAGPIFARGLTLDNLFIGVTTDPVSNIVGVSGSGTYYYLKTTPVSVTDGWTRPTLDEPNVVPVATINGVPSIPLKQGLWVQLTKWDLISHVLVGYTAPTQFEFERNAQVLTKEYQMAPVWAHAIDQFRRFPGYTGNNNPIKNNDFYSGNPVNAGVTDNMTMYYVNGFNGDIVYAQPAAQKQFIGLVEKPSRIFVPCRDAAHVYIQVKGDYTSHAIGSGFWNWETGQWSATSLYERSYYASSFAGFTGSEPNLSGVCGDNDYGTTVGTSIAAAGGGPPSNATAIAQILASYTNNPFIRVWGY